MLVTLATLGGPAHAREHSPVTYVARLDQKPHRARHPCSCGAVPETCWGRGWSRPRASLLGCRLRVCVGRGRCPLLLPSQAAPTPLRRALGASPGHVAPPAPLVLSYPSISGLRIPETCWATRPFRSDWKPRSMSTEKLPEENAAECLRRFHLWCVKLRLISVSLFYAFPCFPSSTRYYIKIQILNYEKIEKAGF